MIGATVLVVSVLLALVLAKRSGDESALTAGRPVPVPAQTPESGGASSPPDGVPLVRPDQLKNLMLTAQDLNTELGTTAMTLVHESDSRDNTNTSRTDCGTAPYAGLTRGMEGSQYTAVERQVMDDLPSGVRVTQVLTTFTGGKEADEFFATQRKAWLKCGKGAPVTLTTPDQPPEEFYLSAPEKDVPGVLSISLSKRGDDTTDSTFCQHSLTVRHNVGVDVMICGFRREGRSAPAVAAAVADRVPGR